MRWKMSSNRKKEIMCRMGPNLKITQRVLLDALKNWSIAEVPPTTRKSA